MADYWSNRVVFGKVAGLELASVTFEVTADFSTPLPTAFGLVATARVAGVYVGRTTMDPIADGPLKLALAAPTGQNFGDLEGHIADWRGLDATGNTLLPGGDWTTAPAVAFSVVGDVSITIPISVIAAVVPHLDWLIAIALKAFGPSIVISIGHEPIVLPIHRDANGEPLPQTV